MEEIKLIKDICNECQFLIDDGYQYSIIEGIISYKKEIGEEGYELSLRYFEWTNSFYRIDAFVAKKRFNVIEQKIQNILKGEFENYFTIYILPTLNDIPFVEHKIYDNHIEFIVKNSNDIEKVIQFFKSFYYQTAVPFFEKYNNIEVVDRQLQNLMETKKIQSLLTDSGGNSAILRYYTIGLMCNNQFVINFFENTYYPHISQQKDKLSIVEYNHLIELKNIIQWVMFQTWGNVSNVALKN